jgi:hypothetical protein
LPRRVAWFYLRAVRAAYAGVDDAAIAAALPPAELVRLLHLARGARRVLEIGTGPAWTAIALALDDEERLITTVDNAPWRGRERYLALVGARLRARIELQTLPFRDAAKAVRRPVEMVFVGPLRSKEDVKAAFEAAAAVVVPEGIVVLQRAGGASPDDATAELAVGGRPDDGFLVWRKPRPAEPPAPAPARHRRRRARVVAALLAALAIGGGVGFAATRMDDLFGDDSGGKSTAASERLPGPRGLAQGNGRGQGSARRKGRARSELHGPPVTHGRARPRRTRGRNRSKRTRRQRVRHVRHVAGTAGETFSGTGARGLGTVRLPVRSTLQWTSARPGFAIRSDALRLESRRRSGRLSLSAGEYQHFRVRAKGRWTIRIVPRS